ncbi:MAG: histidine ammonia-lyase [Bacteroidetes bacterium]|nr:MAG: histidine ammonia-lyase [Bacteroidota bacterium]REK07611.1 MAG: histidine ammonia-lyase [Bacteroidota bacterium]REK36957.1 MAG: histidine ammonia-lyase [Bacteroidota bacterium]REK47777.1 MAG: histidine ammonia-lyase [Bacteroidota bacterium]
MSTYKITLAGIEFDKLPEILAKGNQISLGDEVKKSVKKGRDYLDRKLKENADPVYGINTGFGALYNRIISEKDLAELQRNLVMSHACGTGEMLPADIVKLMLLLKIQSLAAGNSAVQLPTIQRLVDMYNQDVLPVVYTQGSLGASGDLAPLAHLSLPLIGEGEVLYEGKAVLSAKVLKKLGWKPIELHSKEGLALLNGTQFMSACGVHSLLGAYRLCSLADKIAAVSLEAFDGRPEPFDALIHKVRPHQGQMDVAENFRNLLKGSEIIRRKKQHVQDPYSFRCIPQVHGASRDAVNYAGMVMHTEINSVTDNPTVFPDEDKIISGGNFHGQPLALAMDFLAIALSELGNISERRTYQLISGQRGLPPFLADDPGLHSGFMIPQYTAASVVSQNKQLCTPASVDSIVSSNGQEDHVSMGANSAVKLLKVCDNLVTILAIEMMTAVQAFEYRRPLKSSSVLEKFISDYRKKVTRLDKDRILHNDIVKSREFLLTN